MQVEDHCPEPIARVLDAALAVLRRHAAPAAPLDAALAAGRLVGQLTEDADLAVGAMLDDASPACTRAPAEWPAADRRALGEPALRAAAELARIGGFGRGAHWGSPSGLTGDQAETLRKMLLAVASDPRLVVARIALQLARLRAAHGAGSGASTATDAAESATRRELAAEARAVFAPLANRLGIRDVKWELEDLALRELEPQAYRRIAKALAQRRADRERDVDEACSRLAAALRAAGLHAEVSGRAKHIHGIHRKMQEKRLPMQRIFDLNGLRVVCRTVPDCYAALGVVHDLWSWLPDGFADYVATPKDNGYRSIHTVVLGPGGRPLEVQLRTAEMHEFAERGVAAHWRYKEGGGGDAAYARKIESIRRLLGPQGGAPAGGELDFLADAQRGLFADRVYALTPRGEVVDLGRGATPLDFAYQVHTSLGHRCRGARVDGRIVPLTHRLANGEVVEVIASRDEAPSRDWLHQDGYLASARSRAKVRAWFRRSDAGENEAAGRAIAERELARMGAGAEATSALVQDLKASDAQQLYRWLGEGEIGANQLVQALLRRLPRATPGAAPATPGARPERRRRPPQGAAAPAAVAIEGVADLPITLARCCGPAQPCRIAGYVTVGRGVTVHEHDCAALARMRRSHPERVLAADWR